MIHNSIRSFGIWIFGGSSVICIFPNVYELGKLVACYRNKEWRTYQTIVLNILHPSSSGLFKDYKRTKKSQEVWIFV